MILKIRSILISIVIFFILDYCWYLYQKKVKFKNYENYIDYIKKSIGKE